MSVLKHCLVSVALLTQVGSTTEILREDNIIYFSFGPTLYRLDTTTNETTTLITNFSFDALAEPYYGKHI